MTTLYYNKGSGPSVRADRIKTLELRFAEKPQAYRPAPGLREAVDAALILGKPLLVTGEPGTGKTQLADSIAYELGKGTEDPEAPEVPVRKFETKSTSIARDLFYTYDAIAAFQSAQSAGGPQRPPTDFVRFEALGRAIMEAFPADNPAVKRLWPRALDPSLPDEDRHLGPRRSVVLIDEVDKAPRDFPNDLLNEIERLYFRVAEIENLPSPNADGKSIETIHRPIVIITSNSEKTLPDPFLRRCVYFHVEFPSEPEMREIVKARLPELGDAIDLVEDALKLFYELRGADGGPNLRKPPSTAELIDWLRLMREVSPSQQAKDRGSVFEKTISALVKNTEDRQLALDHLTTKFKPSA